MNLLRKRQKRQERCYNGSMTIGHITQCGWRSSFPFVPCISSLFISGHVSLWPPLWWLKVLLCFIPICKLPANVQKYGQKTASVSVLQFKHYWVLSFKTTTNKYNLRFGQRWIKKGKVTDMAVMYLLGSNQYGIFEANVISIIGRKKILISHRSISADTIDKYYWRNVVIKYLWQRYVTEAGYLTF